MGQQRKGKMEQDLILLHGRNKPLMTEGSLFIICSFEQPAFYDLSHKKYQSGKSIVIKSLTHATLFCHL
jgi:hypothetical protein